MSFPGDASFEAVERFVYRVSVSAGAQEAHGTGFVVGRVHKTGQLVLATARHVLETPGEGELNWRVAQFDRTGTTRREIAFKTGDSKEPLPFRWHRELDVAVITLPPHVQTGEPFSEYDRGLRFIDPAKGVSTGTRIAWAGFPGTVEDLLGHPQLCYFEGSVSSMIDGENQRFYIADGHAAPGVSGGPVWHWSEEASSPEVIGIVSSYAPSHNNLPGFCVFEPVNSVFYYLANWHVSLPGGYDNFVVMSHGGQKGNAA